MPAFWQLRLKRLSAFSKDSFSLTLISDIDFPPSDTTGSILVAFRAFFERRGYYTGHFVKCQGKKLYDKRASIKAHCIDCAQNKFNRPKQISKLYDFIKQYHEKV